MGNIIDKRAGGTQFSDPSQYEVHKARQAMDALLSAPAPCRTLANLARSDAAGLEPFERYASITLADAGAGTLASLPPGYGIHLKGPEDGQLARFVFKGLPSRETRALLNQVEDALNRLICLCDALEDAKRDAHDAHAAHDGRIRISWMGVDRNPRQPGWRSAHVQLPRLAPSTALSEAYFNEVDWRMLDNVASTGRALFQNSLKPNARQSVLGATAPDGSDWDVRTRLAALLGRMELSLAFSFRYDCDVERHAIDVVFATPPVTSFPQRKPTPALDALEELGECGEAARRTYALRLAALVGCACFGAGHRIETARVTAEDAAGNKLFICVFDRTAFVRGALAAIDDGTLASPDLRFDPAGVSALLGSNCVKDKGDTPLYPVCPIGSNRVKPWCDERELPQDLRELFGAKRVCDLDTGHNFGGFSDVIETAKADSADSMLAAIAQLEQLLESIVATPPDDNATSRPLYCDNPFSRIAIPLVADELSVGERAQEFVQGKDPEGTMKIPQFFRAPSALFHAHMGLSDLYQRMGDFAGAIAHADACIALAPTTASAYFRKADILAQQTRNAEAMNVLTAGLCCAISKRDCALLYYHLGLLLWRVGRKSDAAAVQVYTSSLQGEFAEKARAVVKSLRTRRNTSVIVHASPLAAAREMARARIPLAPNEMARTLIARAAIGLSCANAPEAAAPYIAELTTYLPGDRIIATTSCSIIHGTCDWKQP